MPNRPATNRGATGLGHALPRLGSWLLLAAGCGGNALHAGRADSSASAGGTTFQGGSGGQGGADAAISPGSGGARDGGGTIGSGGSGRGGVTAQGGTAGTRGGAGGGPTGGIVGTGGRGGALGSGGRPGTGGVIGSGGRSGTGGGGAGAGGVATGGGVTTLGGRTGTGGSRAGGAPGTGGSGGSGGATGGFTTLGMPCTATAECGPEALCCDGSVETCDGVRLPVGDGANPGELVVSADGLTVTDTISGLIWQRDGSSAREGCSSSNGLACSWGEAQAYCESLVLGGVEGWRLPAWMELLTILDFTAGAAPFIDQAAFPDSLTAVSAFWTSTPHAGPPYSGPVSVDFGEGSSVYCRNRPSAVRCVRGSRCYPNSRFQVLDGGLVRDRLTGLVWQQEGSTTEMTWADAQSYCAALGASFRLPTLKELDSIMDPSATSGGALDKTAFPDAGAGHYWTSSVYQGPGLVHVGDMHYGDFSDGLGNYCELASCGCSPLSSTLLVRCVR